MCILQTRFADTHRGKGESSWPKVVVTVDDNGNDEDDVAETETGTYEQESVSCVGGMDEDLNEGQYCNRDEGIYTGPDTRSEEPDDLYVPLGFVAPTVENMADRSPEVGPCLPPAIIDTMQDASKVRNASQDAEDTLLTPLLGTLDATVDTTLHLPTVPPYGEITDESY
ncbi:hypothetical protein L3X38_036735 [Prunus dulcis]|uniref:Uncharacterized protein n=1 Tax=Prunus dulcis TaxID=3755 RepID=A0AAD4V2B3_PRUDU|nr:hypothetical protein L3X38_036735 [Prunus dulcis]